MALEPLQHQFRLPRGLLGRAVGWVMSRENRRMNRMAIDWLQVGSGDDVLEIGFGPGHGLELLIKRTVARTIAGIDPSSVMVEQARERNAAAYESGRLSLVMGSVDQLPFADGQFSRVVAVSNLHVWPSEAAGLREIQRVLQPTGLLVICLRRAKRNAWPWTSPGISTQQLSDDQDLLRQCGFARVQLATRKIHRRLVCLMATK